MKKEKAPTQPEQDQAVVLDDDSLEEVSGGTNPFADIPRVPNQPIDSNVRENG